MRIEFYFSNLFSTIDKYIPPVITRVALAALAVFGSAYVYHSWQKGKAAQVLSEKGLEDAVRVGNLAEVQKLMQGNRNLIPFVDRKGLLSYAVNKEYFTVADYLVQQGAKLDAENRLTGTPLYYAAFEGNLQGVQWLLSKGADPDRGKENYPPLMQAIMRGKFDVAKFLINNGASLKFEESVFSPLFLMGQKGKTPERDEIIHLMFSKGAVLTDDEKMTVAGKEIEAMRAAN